jgi:hypothetical protein
MARETNTYGHTRSDVIRQTLDAAGLEAVSLGEIISDGRMFDLEDDELIAYVREGVLALLGSGAHIVEQSTERGGEWSLLPEFDLPKDEAVASVLQMWEAKGREAAFFVWFYRGSID